MKKNRYSIILLLALLTTLPLTAQEKEHKGLIRSAMVGLEYRIKAGFNIGGTSPIPLPREIRELKSYAPTVAIAVEADICKKIDAKWGVLVGVRVETKGMETDARVKNYHMEMTADDGGYMSGSWTGNVRTKVRNSYLSFPVLATYQLSKRWELRAGPYFSYVTSREFSGSAYDGYLRNQDPTGEKVYVTTAVYDFSDDLRRFQWGAQLGAEWKAYKHLSLYADLEWGLNSIFPKDFKSVTFDMYPIYANLGFAYVF